MQFKIKHFQSGRVRGFLSSFCTAHFYGLLHLNRSTVNKLFKLHYTSYIEKLSQRYIISDYRGISSIAFEKGISDPFFI